MIVSRPLWNGTAGKFWIGLYMSHKTEILPKEAFVSEFEWEWSTTSTGRLPG